MQKEGIPPYIAEAIVAMLRPYAPDVTATQLKTAIFRKPSERITAPEIRHRAPSEIQFYPWFI